MKKKLSTGLVIVLILTLLTAAVALAASLGVFGQLGQMDINTIDPRMNDLETVSSVAGQTVTTQDGITITIQQTYYNGSRVFISYELSGALASLEKNKGVPENIEWLIDEPGIIYGNKYFSDSPEGVEVAEWLDGNEPRCVKQYSAALHDGLYLLDDTYVEIIGGDSVIQEDGSVVGWKECEIPPEIAKDELTLKAVLFRGTQIIYQDSEGYKFTSDRDPETTDVVFTVTKDNSAVKLTGTQTNDIYSAVADMTLSPIDLRGTLTMTCPDSWVHDLQEWDGSGGDMIDDWALYAGGVDAWRPISTSLLSNDNPVIFELCFQYSGNADDLMLVPVYRDSGAHVDEGIRLLQP